MKNTPFILYHFSVGASFRKRFYTVNAHLGVRFVAVSRLVNISDKGIVKNEKYISHSGVVDSLFKENISVEKTPYLKENARC